MSVPSKTAEKARACDFYRRVLELMREEEIPFLVGGAYALAQYTGVCRDTKDVDVFVRPTDCRRVLRLLADAGFETEVTSPIWLAKARCGDDFVDVIFSSGNAIAEVDEAWFEHAGEGEVLGVPVKLVPPEEMIWSKGYIMERERYDGADILHLIRARGPRLDWHRLLARFGPHGRVLMSHLVLFGFVYPGERDAIPRWVVEELIERLRAELEAAPPAGQSVCQGTLLSRTQYRIDCDGWGYRDGRIRPNGRMTRRQAEAVDRER
ncbi:MAG TPA: nucleotidyltransferase [Candidatus Binatus sp.]|nr:nucleotidyltransferase [Candidatus Binatus sp.]